MALPPIEALFQPVSCMPGWVARYAAIPNTKVSSGCSTVDGKVMCDPRAMAEAAARKTGLPVTLEAYTLARYITSEVGTRSVPERVAVGQAAVNRVKYTEPRLGNVLNLLLYRQDPNGPCRSWRGYFGPIHGTPTNPACGKPRAPYGRWAATSADPALSNLIIAVDILNGKIPADFSKGADDQYGPEILVREQGLAVTQDGVRRRGGENRYWVGPLPGVDSMRTFLYTYRRDVLPTSDAGRALIARGVAAMAQGRPNWSGLPGCAEAQRPFSPMTNKTAAIVVGATTVAAIAAIGAAIARRRRVAV